MLEEARGPSGGGATATHGSKARVAATYTAWGAVAAVLLPNSSYGP